MTPAINPVSGKRTSVLRPRDAVMALQRLREWNEILDRAEPFLEGGDVASAEALQEEARVHWVAMLQEQPWTFQGWLGADLKTLVFGEKALGLVQGGDAFLKEDDYVAFLESSRVEMPT